MRRPPPSSTLFPYTTLFRSFLQHASSRTATLAQSVDALLQQLIKLLDRKSTRLNSSHVAISYAVFCLKKKIAVLGRRQLEVDEHEAEQREDRVQAIGERQAD